MSVKTRIVLLSVSCVINLVAIAIGLTSLCITHQRAEQMKRLRENPPAARVAAPEKYIPDEIYFEDDDTITVRDWDYNGGDPTYRDVRMTKEEFRREHGISLNGSPWGVTYHTKEKVKP